MTNPSQYETLKPQDHNTKPNTRRSTIARKDIKLGSPEFKDLQDKWYRKLEKDGFEDMEVTKDRQGRLTPQSDSPKWVSRQKGRREELLEFYTMNSGETLSTQSLFQYYRLARIFLSHGTFASIFHEFVFEMYAEGLSYRKMIPHIRKKFSKRPRSVETISKIMRTNKEAMLQFHLTHPEGEYLHATEVPAILNPDYSPHLKTKRGKSKYK